MKNKCIYTTLCCCLSTTTQAENNVCFRITLLSEGCLLCCGVAAVYYMEKMKRNLQDWVCISPLFQALLIFVTSHLLYSVLDSRWVPTWSWRIFCHQRNREGNITSCFVYIIFVQLSYGVYMLATCLHFDFWISVVFYISL